MKSIRIVLITIFSVSIFNINAQEIDSLLRVINVQKEDTNKVKALLELCDKCPPPQILLYAQQALDLALKLNYQNGIANSYGNIGTYFYYKYKEEQAIEYHLKALQIYLSLNDKKGVGKMYCELGGDYSHLTIRFPSRGENSEIQNQAANFNATETPAFAQRPTR